MGGACTRCVFQRQDGMLAEASCTNLAQTRYCLHDSKTWCSQVGIASAHMASHDQACHMGENDSDNIGFNPSGLEAWRILIAKRTCENPSLKAPSGYRG